MAQFSGIWSLSQVSQAIQDNNWTNITPIAVEYLVVAGGGSGGGSAGNGNGGGGGAGGVLSGITSVSPNLVYQVVVGAGGGNTSATNGSNGSNSSFGSIIAYGGGGGGGNAATAGVLGLSGGSGGGAGGANNGIGASGGTGISGQGNRGGNGTVGSAVAPGAPGGGGAGTPGLNGPVSGNYGNGGNGGAGVASDISGTRTVYGGGGGGGAYYSGTTPGVGGAGGGGAGGQGTGVYMPSNGLGNGTANTGGGGGGSGQNFQTGGGGAGGSGIVILSYVASSQKFTGGTVTTANGKYIHTFTSSGTFGAAVPRLVSYAVVAGGAGGGNGNPSGGAAGGGGAGGMLSGTNLILDTSSTYAVTVGAGGNGGLYGGTAPTNGGVSSISVISATGGGKGASYNSSSYVAGANGGSGGGGGGNTPYVGAGSASPAGQGNAGGVGANATGAGGGGGGAGAAGTASTVNQTGAAGGVGLANPITGSVSGQLVSGTYYFAGGGGGGSWNNATPIAGGAGGNGGGGAGGSSGTSYSAVLNATAGTVNTGGGGGGSGAGVGAGVAGNGGNGGSGIVIVAYPGSVAEMDGGDVTIAGGNVIHTFTTSGVLAPIVNTPTRSLRFRSSNSAYLSRTPTVSSDRTRFTWSGWIKRTTFGSYQMIAQAGDSNNVSEGFLYFLSDDSLRYAETDSAGATAISIGAYSVYRDAASWYHIVLAVDTTQSTSTERVKIYVNGVNVTNTSGTYPSINYNTAFNNKVVHRIATRQAGIQYLGANLTEINYVDGFQLDASYFGGTDRYTGSWVPSRYSGPFGTNGYYLPMNYGADVSTYSGAFGSSKYLSATQNINIKSDSFTMEAWVRLNTTGLTANYNEIFIGDFTSGTGKFYLAYNGNSGRFYLSDALTDTINYVASLAGNTWYHIAVTFDGATYKLFINGTLASSSTTLLVDRTITTLRIGGGYNGNWNGDISNVRVIKGSAIYSTSFMPPVSPLKVVSGTTLLTLQESTITDRSVNAYTITNTGSVAVSSVTNVFQNLATLSADRSGNGNNFTTSGISFVNDYTLDSITDVPYSKGITATSANYCTMNPLDNYTVTDSSFASYTAGTTIITRSNQSWSSGRSTMAMSSGKWYAEMSAVTSTAGGFQAMFGICKQEYIISDYFGGGSGGYGYNAADGKKYNGGAGATYASTFAVGDVIGVAYDADVGTLSFYKNGTSLGNAYTGLTGTYCFAVSLFPQTSGSITAFTNFGQRPFTYTPPSGYSALNTFNLATPAVKTPSTYFDATLYTGVGTTNPITVSNAAGNFKPDLLWIKGRNITYAGNLIDSVRGVNKVLLPQGTDAEATSTTGNGVISIDSNGFTLGNEQSTTGSTNAAYNYVAWQWKANGSTTVTNTSGSITSQVSANTTSGFSIATFTGNGTAGATVGHGLGVAPSMIIVKSRGAARNWIVYHASIGATQFMQLDTSIAATAATSAWNDTAPTSSVFSLGTSLAGNESGITRVAYSFAEVAGYSKFGSYKGSGATDGPFVYTGFKPRWILFKDSSSATWPWVLVDTARNTYNALSAYLTPQGAAEATNFTGGVIMDCVSNGFKVRSSDAYGNTNNDTIIYAAFAESPFKYATAR